MRFIDIFYIFVVRILGTLAHSRIHLVPELFNGLLAGKSIIRKKRSVHKNGALGAFT